jgi:hypothetical protein
MKKYILGSEVFGTTQIKTDEYIMLAKVMVENGSPLEQADAEIHAIDDMLSMQKISSIINSRRFTSSGRIRKDSRLSDMISNRLDKLLIELKEMEKR